MTTILIRKTKDSYQGFNCIGHAGYADAGSDIICAAVSVLVFNCLLYTSIFFLIFVYIIICVGIYLFRDQKVVAYRVQEGALSVDNIYTAIALRDETVVTSSYNGYINYYAVSYTHLTMTPPRFPART